MRVLVDVVEHQAGGADPSLARQLTSFDVSSEGSSGLLMVLQNPFGGVKGSRKYF